ncbi:MAG: hypothetical protein HQK83_05760 [Fibrobacteria bacterium]|nr:hypothetical protein [Fibrobacteria bacterium]
MDTIIQNLPDYFDFNWLTIQLKDYASPRVKINSLLKTKEIIRIKKGLYIPGPKYNRTISKGALANLIFGPSYVSFEYALSRHGLIPERVYPVTCACSKRNKSFNTPLGVFSYRNIPERAYPQGVDLVREADYQFLMASPEKALADMLAKSGKLHNLSELETLLFEDKRMEPHLIRMLDKKKMDVIARTYKKHNVFLILDYLQLRFADE